MIKKAMILAAGLGTRLRPLTNILPKPLVPLLDQPLLIYHLKQLANIGVEEVVVNLHSLPEIIKETIQDGAKWGIKVHYSLETPEILGTGGGLSKVQSFFEDEEAFLIVNGDILCEMPWTQVIEHHKQQQAVATLLVRTHPGDQSGWVGTNGTDQITRVPDMPEDTASTKHQFTGLHVLSPAIFPHLPKNQFGCVLRTGYRKMLESGLKVSSYNVDDAVWRDIGNPSTYHAANIALLREHNERTGENNYIGKDVTIGKGAVLKGCIVGEGATIGENACLEDSIIWRGVHVADGTNRCRVIHIGDEEIVIEK